MDKDVVASGLSDHRGGHRGGQLDGAVDCRRQCHPVENNDGSADELGAIYRQLERRRYLRKRDCRRRN